MQIRVYDDRVVLSNPGGLPAGLTVNDLLQDPHDSLPRNPILAQVCYYPKFVEQWGSGTLRMSKACRVAGLPDPEFQSKASSFFVTLRQDELSDQRLKQMGMNERQIKAVHIVRQQGSISNAEYQRLIGPTRRTAARDLEQMVNKNVFYASSEAGRTVRYFMVGTQHTENLSNVP